MNLSLEHQRLLLAVAREAIARGFTEGAPWSPEPSAYPTALRVPAATFVTLERCGALRGCIGTLTAHQPLVADVAEHAFGAAFHDPRFAPLAAAEWPDTAVSISVLSPPVPLAFADEQDLLRQIRPGQDGLILEDQGHRATFLPAVWESLPEKADFWRHLKAKAGLQADHWSPTLAVKRYTATKFA